MEGEHMRGGLTRRLRSLHCWQLRWAAPWSLWSPVYELQTRNKRQSAATERTSSKKLQSHTQNAGLGSDSPESLLLIVNLISDLEGNLLHATYCFHSESCVLSPQMNPHSDIHFFLKAETPLSCLCFPLRPSIIHHISFACEAAPAHHAILVPAL